MFVGRGTNNKANTSRYLVAWPGDPSHAINCLMNEAPWQRRASAKWYVLFQGKHGTRCNANIENQISWYICTVVALLFLVARLSTRYQRLRSLGIDDGLITLAACCLIGDLIIQQYMWNLGMANIPKASREELIQIMKVFDVHNDTTGLIC